MALSTSVTSTAQPWLCREPWAGWVCDEVWVLVRLPHPLGHAVGAIAVEDFQLQPALFEIFLCLAEKFGGGLAQHRLGFGVELLPHKVVLRRVAHV